MHSVSAPPGAAAPIPAGAMYHGVPTPPAPPIVATVPTPPDLRSVPIDERVAAGEYDEFLSQLTFNSKEIINNLTKIAGENIKSANGLSFVIERRILDALPNGKLPYLYLLDSIVKNIGDVYVHKFSRNLYNVFRAVYSSAAPQTKSSLHRLLNTWPPLFGLELVNALRRSAVECDSNPQPDAMHHGGYQSSGLQSQRIPRVPLSRPPAPAPAYQGNHPTRTRSIVQIPIPKRTPQVGLPHQAPQLTGVMGMGMPVGVSAAVSQIQASGTPPMILQSGGMQSMAMQSMGMQSMSMPIGGMNRMFNMQGAVNGGQPSIGAVRNQGVQGLQGAPQVYGMSQPYQMQQQVAMESMIPGQANGYHQGGALPPTGRLYANGGVAMGTAGANYYAEKMRETERMMDNITRKSAVGIVATSDELAALNNLINAQLGSGLPSDRERLLDMQRRVAALSQPVAHVAHQRAPPLAYTAPAPRAVVPTLNASTLSNLMRSLPKLAASARAVQQHSASLAQAPGRTPLAGPEPLSYSAIRTTSHTAFVRGLYTDLPHLSKSDGMRFASKEELRAHLDWLFARNRRKRARDRNMTTVGLSRCWLDPLSVFLGETSAASAAPSASSGVFNSTTNDSITGKPAEANDPFDQNVEARGDNETCPACREGFTTFWDDDKQAWMIKEALRNANGVAFHTRCAASVADIDAAGVEELFVEDVATSPLVKQEGRGTVDVPAKAELYAGAQRNDVANKVTVKQEISGTTKVPPNAKKGEVTKADPATMDNVKLEVTLSANSNETVNATGTETLKRKSCEISKTPLESRDPRGPVKRAKLDNVQAVASK